MRRKGLYSVARLLAYKIVGLLAIGIGFYFVQIYLWQAAEKKNESVNWTSEEIEQLILSNQNLIKEKSRKEKYLSEKEKALILFEPTLDKWLSGQKFDANVEPRTEITREITAGKLNFVDENYLLRAAAKNYKPSLIDVNNNGSKELAILSNCSPPEFCELWIFKKTKNDFQVILKTYTVVENFDLRKTKTRGYFDIETIYSYPGSKTSLGMNIYKFNGENYEMKECYDYIYLYEDENGELHKLAKPRFSPLHCC